MTTNPDVPDQVVVDHAWNTVWLEGPWRWVTRRMTTPEREAAADAVERHWARIEADDPGLNHAASREALRWWRLEDSADLELLDAVRNADAACRTLVRVMRKRSYPPEWPGYAEPQPLSWDYKEQPDLDELATAVQEVSAGRVHVTRVKTGTQDYAIVLSGQPLTEHSAYGHWAGEEPNVPNYRPDLLTEGDLVRTASGRAWMVWSHALGMWLGEPRRGYESRPLNAGLYTFLEAETICDRAVWAPDGVPSEVMVLRPCDLIMRADHAEVLLAHLVDVETRRRVAACEGQGR